MTSLDIPVVETERLMLRGMVEHDLDGYESDVQRRVGVPVVRRPGCGPGRDVAVDRHAPGSLGAARYRQWALEQLASVEVISMTLPDATTSRGVMEKLGLVFDRLTRNEWTPRG